MLPKNRKTLELYASASRPRPLAIAHHSPPDLLRSRHQSMVRRRLCIATTSASPIATVRLKDKKMGRGPPRIQHPPATPKKNPFDDGQ
nr:30S ribosomal protein S31, chloroplastic [Ipomoea batatas]